LLVVGIRVLAPAETVLATQPVLFADAPAVAGVVDEHVFDQVARQVVPVLLDAGLELRQDAFVEDVGVKKQIVFFLHVSQT
jgi:hypothetical protein